MSEMLSEDALEMAGTLPAHTGNCLPTQNQRAFHPRRLVLLDHIVVILRWGYAAGDPYIIPAARMGYFTRYPSRIHQCPVCFSQWAMVLRDSDGAEVQISHCESCGDGSILSTSNFSGIDYQLLASLPEPLLRREFELNLKAFSNVHYG